MTLQRWMVNVELTIVADLYHKGITFSCKKIQVSVCACKVKCKWFLIQCVLLPANQHQFKYQDTLFTDFAQFLSGKCWWGWSSLLSCYPTEHHTIIKHGYCWGLIFTRYTQPTSNGWSWICFILLNWQLVSTLPISLPAAGNLDISYKGNILRIAKFLWFFLTDSGISGDYRLFHCSEK